MSNPQSPLDPCPCWGTTTVKIRITHCPSLNLIVRDEIDRVTRFVNEQTRLNRLGKVKIDEIDEAHRRKHDVSSLSAEADAGSLPPSA